jgi:acyl carrier protein
MSEQDAVPLTKAQIAAAPADQRAGLVEAFLIASISALNRDRPEPVTASCRLADLAIDSLQLVELKFGLDQALGNEIDIELIIGNPTLSELASSSVREAGL